MSTIPDQRNQGENMRIRALAFAAFTATALLNAPAVMAQATQAASTTAANDLPAVDKEFVQIASMSSSTEIDASKLALKQSSDMDVKKFATHMIASHTKLTVQLKAAAPKGVTVPKDNSDTAVLDSLKGKSGKEFDELYIKQVGLEGHKKTIDGFQKEIDSGENASLKKAAANALPAIKEHYRMAQDLAKKKGVSM
jgi:putative membrane protein